MPKSTLVVDSSQIATFLECPQKWYYHYVKRLEPVTMPETEGAMRAGTFCHKLLDIYYRYRTRHLNLNDITEAVFSYDPDTDICECGCQKDMHCPVPALGIEECTKCKKCTKFRPHPFELDTKDRKKVYNTMRNYISYYHNKEDYMPPSEQYVESGFSAPIFEDSQNLFVLEGRIDMIAKRQGLEMVVDHKVQFVSHWLYQKSIQMKNYSLVTGISNVEINYIRLMDKPAKPELAFTRDLINFFPPQREAWKRRLIDIFFRMKAAIENPKGFERNWNACDGGYMTYDRAKPKYCWYTGLCEEINLGDLQRAERTLFKINPNPWRPW